MTESSTPTRLHELLADRALVGLTAAEEAELATLLGSHPYEDADAFDRAAAATHLALMVGKLEPLPEHLANKIAEGALPKNPRPSRVVALPKRRDRLQFAGWIAAAACLAIAIGAIVSRKSPEPTAIVVPSPTGTPSTITPPPTPPKSAAELREQLLTKADAVKIAWTATKDPGAGNASGDVVFSVAEQRGYMRFHGLAQNDPAAHQYQLWIFDKAQDKRYPIDGGVFDIDSATGDVIVPITAKIRVTNPTLFAVTVEAPGGVVVSKREHIVVTAARS